ncbi:MAG: hypothetical protein C0456_20240, partial [Hyphomonas sp.]|uniref:hypothetical protein n=1 Tax=Hyphomonas sp. TaxID=87 RepID=UPI001D59221D
MKSNTFHGSSVHRRPAEFVAIDGVIDGAENGKIGAVVLAYLTFRKAFARDMPDMLSDGGGLYCRQRLTFNDAAELLVLRSTDRASCKFPIDCKAQIEAELSAADVVMLTQAEAENLDFPERTKALKLGN